MVTLDAIRGPVAQELEEFDAFVRRNFKVENKLLSGMVDYILSSRGKGVRPLLVLLSAALNAPAGGRGIGQRTYLAAMLVEIIHTASLIHDDVIDEADTRRGRASANAKWQSRNAVVLGDYLLARNMELGMRSGQYDLVSYVIASIATLCEGELLQSDRAERMEITRDAYLEIIYKKTASLLGISAGVGALSAGANREQVARMRRFGDALGMAFQIQDDILDFTRGAETGKPSNNDLREHKITLPLLLLLDRADAARRDELLALLARCREDEAAVDALQQAVEEQGGLQEASKVMQSYLQRATALLAEWSDPLGPGQLVRLRGRTQPITEKTNLKYFMETQKKNYVLPIAMMFALFAMISFVTGLQNPMGIIVKNQFGASNFMSQLGNAANFIAYAFMGLPAGLMLQRIGYKKTALAAVAVGFIGVGISYLSGLMSSFSVYLIGAFVSGFSMCMLNTVVNPMLNTLGGGGNRGNQLVQFGGSLNSLAATIVPVLVGYLMGNAAQATISNAAPALFIAMGIFALAFVVMLVMEIPEPFALTNEKSAEKNEHSALSFRHFVLGTVAIFVYVGVEVGIPNFANLFMTTDLGIDTTVAGSVVGTYWFLMLIGRFAGGLLGAKVSPKAMLSTVASAACLLVVCAMLCPVSAVVSMPVFQSDISFGMAQVPVSIMLLVLCGLCTSVMWGGIFNLAVEGLGKYTSAASGIFMVMVCGGGILPLIQGLVADHAGYMMSFWVVFAGVLYILYYALAGHRNVNTDIKVD